VPTGAVVKSRLLAIIEAEQTERKARTERNDRLLAKARQHQRGRCDRRHFGTFPEKHAHGDRELFLDYDRQQGKTFKPLRPARRQGPLRVCKESSQMTPEKTY